MRRTKEAGVFAYTDAEYHADPSEVPSLSSHIAQLITRFSPLHAWTAHPRLNPNFESEEKEEFDWGRAAHDLLLRGEDKIVIVPFDSYRKADAQAIRDQARADGKYPVLAHKVDRLYKMRDAAQAAIARCRHFAGLELAKASIEETIIWEDGQARCRARPDAWWQDIGMGFDYKTTENASPSSFSHRVPQLGYGFQMAFYLRGLRAVYGLEEPRYILMAQESEAPFSCAFYEAAPTLVDVCEEEVERAIRTWEYCLTKDRWPGYDTKVIHAVEAPNWQLSEHMERIEARQGHPYDPAVLFGEQESA